MVNVWGAWCAECRTETPLLVDAADELPGGATVVGIDIRDSSKDNALAYVRGFGMPYPSIYDPGSETLLDFPPPFNPRDIPSTVVLDRQGRVAALIRGELPSKLTLLDVVEKVAAEREMGDWLRDTAFSGSMVLAVPVAVLAGLVSFFSPCVIPLLPGYLSYTTGLSGADLADSEARPAPRPDARRLVAVRARLLGRLRRPGRAVGQREPLVLREPRTFTIVLGVLPIVLGLAFMGLVPLFQRDVRVHTVPAVGLAAAPLLGFLFGLGWTPCIGPTLA